MTMFIKLENDSPVGYPIIEENFRQLFPDSPYFMSVDMLTSLGYAYYDFSTPPDVAWNQKSVEITPTLNSNGVYYQTWQVVDLTGEELEQAKVKFMQEQKILIKGKSDWRLDEFARTKDYYTILHACTYAMSSDPIRAAEAQHCINVRDLTWNKVYEILAEVDSGIRPFTTTFEQIESELPTLEWPT